MLSYFFYNFLLLLDDTILSLRSRLFEYENMKLVKVDYNGSCVLTNSKEHAYDIEGVQIEIQ